VGSAYDGGDDDADVDSALMTWVIA
jgi:hypothetical protein